MQFLLFAACHQPGLLSSYEKKNQGACRGQTFSSGPAQYHTTNRKGGHCLREKMPGYCAARSFPDLWTAKWGSFFLGSLTTNLSYSNRLTVEETDLNKAFQTAGVPSLAFEIKHSFLSVDAIRWNADAFLTIRLRARVFYEQIANEAQPSWLLLVENEGE